jgi:hypothetical protein
MKKLLLLLPIGLALVAGITAHAQDYNVYSDTGQYLGYGRGDGNGNTRFYNSNGSYWGYGRSNGDGNTNLYDQAGRYWGYGHSN